jgi:hypothetical protein
MEQRFDVGELAAHGFEIGLDEIARVISPKGMELLSSPSGKNDSSIRLFRRQFKTEVIR